LIVAVTLTGALAGACTSTASTKSANPAPGGPAAAATPPTTAAPAAAPDCGDPKASTRPPAGPLPAPGNMPAGSYMRTIQDRGRLIAGVSPDTLLFGSVNPFTGQFQGFDIDVVKEVSKAIFGDATHVEYHAVTNAQRIPDVQSAAVDLVAHTMTINCARRALVDFSSVYYDAGQKVLVRSDSTATKIDDLGGKKVCAPLGTTSIDNLAKVSTHPIAYGVADETDCLVAFQQGVVDAISTDDTVLAGMAAQDPYAKIVGDRFTDEPYGLAINLAHPEFTQFVNAVLERMRADGTWTAIYGRWLSKFGPAPAPPPALYK
jgi:polar amino acid transport system substrate-binding protein